MTYGDPTNSSLTRRTNHQSTHPPRDFKKETQRSTQGTHVLGSGHHDYQQGFETVKCKTRSENDFGWWGAFCTISPTGAHAIGLPSAGSLPLPIFPRRHRRESPKNTYNHPASIPQAMLPRADPWPCPTYSAEYHADKFVPCNIMIHGGVAGQARGCVRNVPVWLRLLLHAKLNTKKSSIKTV